MRVISKARLREFWQHFPEAQQPLENWHRVVSSANWESFSDVRQTFNHADVYQDCTIFDVGGNKYRIVAKVRFQKKKVFIRFVLTHREYDKDAWKAVCG